MERRNKFLTVETGNVVANYSEFVQECFAQMRGREQECLELVELIEQIRRKWKESSEHCGMAEEKCHRIEEENETLRKQYTTLREQYHDAKAQISSLHAIKDDLQQQLKDYEGKIRSMRTLIEKELKNSASFGQLMDLSTVQRAQPSRGELRPRSNDRHLEPIDYEINGNQEDIDEVHLRYNRTYQRRSKSVDPENCRPSNQNVTKRTRSRQIPENIVEEDEEHLTPPKRARDSVRVEDEITTVTTITMDSRGRNPTRASVEVHRNKKRSVSESRILEQSMAPITPSFRLATSSNDLRSPQAFGASWTKGRPILECEHNFDIAKGGLSIMKSCVVCNKTISMKSACKCRDCSIYIHLNCKAQAPMPCLPFVNEKSRKHTPQKKKGVPRLADLCPEHPPLVPAILIRLIYEIERRIDTEGLYRVPGSHESVNRLYLAMQGTAMPMLQLEHTEVLVSTVKKFLNDLKEPLIPVSSYREFIEASRGPTDERFLQAIADLPYPNRDTLAFFVVHLQKVAKHAQSNMMPIENLAKCSGVSVFAGKRRDGNTLEHTSGYDDADRQKYAMERLLKLPEDYWQSYLNSRMLIVASQYRSTSRTPRFTPRHAADQSMLGPVSQTPPLNFTPTMRNNNRRRNLDVSLYD